MIAAALAGAATWTLLEYAIHRWLGHDRRFRGNPFGLEHVRHHIEGDYFAPTHKKVMVAGVVAIVVGALAVLVAGPATGLAYTSGLIGLYVVYEWLHRREHTHEGIGPYARWARRHHFHHHLVSAKANFGVTSPIWDVVFRTYRRPGTIKVPPRLAMRWLVDDAGAILPQHANAFTLGVDHRAERVP